MGGSRRVPLPARIGKSASATRSPATKATASNAPAVKGASSAATGRALARKAAAGKAAASRAAVGATYVYCVVRGAGRPALASDVEALPGAGMPRVLSLDADTWLIVANVPLKAFGEDALRKRMQDVDWMSRCGVAHQALMDAFLDADAVVPMTLFTIFANDERALAEVRKDAARLDASLDRVAGRAEWVVRVLRGDAAAAASPATEPAPAAATRSGRAFLQAKVDQRQAARRAVEETGRAVSGLMTALSDAADDVADRTDAEATGAMRSTALLDAAFLVARADEARFEEAARRMGQPLLDRGFRVSVSGPWPCYSFVSSRSSSRSSSKSSSGPSSRSSS